MSTAQTKQDLLVIVPTRGRPGNAERLARAFHATSTRGAHLRLVVDEDDPEVEEGAYQEVVERLHREGIGDGGRLTLTVGGPGGGGIVKPLNATAAAVAGGYRILGFMGDDHLPETYGWDEQVIAAHDQLGTGLVYGNDLVHRENLPTAGFLSSAIVEVLGYMAPPELKHLWVDNFWLWVGREALGRATYLGQVVIAHLHPVTGKVEWDEGYLRVNDGAVQEHDRAAFEAWVRDTGPAARTALREALG